MKISEFFRELHRRNVWKVAVAYVAAAVVLLAVLTDLFQNFEAPLWVLKVITTLLIVGLPVACLMAWGFEFKDGGVRSVPRAPKETKETKPALPAAETSAPPSIAVLPFEDMSPEQDQKYLGHGIAEELLNALASIGELKVAARTSSFALAGRGASMKDISDELHVRHVLEGSVRRSGRKLRVTAQLIDVQSGFHLFSEAYDRAVEDIFDIQNDLAREIATALLPKLGLDKDVVLVKHGTTNLEAYNLWLQGHQWLMTPVPSTAPPAIEQLRQAVALDPRYADAWGALAYMYNYMSLWASDPAPLLVKATVAGTLAGHLAPQSLMPLLLDAYVAMLIDRDAKGAATYYERARVAGADFSVWAYNKAYLLDGPLGHYELAIRSLKEAEARDPLAPNLKWALMDMYVASGQVDEALVIADANRASSLPDMNVVAGFAYLAAGQIDEARRCLARLQSVAEDYYAEGMMLHFDLDDAVGNRADARSVLELARDHSARGHDVSPYIIGQGYKACGDYDRAIEVWTSAAERRVPWTLSLMPLRNRNHPVMGKDPRFLALLKRMGLEGTQNAAGT